MRHGLCLAPLLSVLLLWGAAGCTQHPELVLAALYGDEARVSELLQGGVDVNVKGSDGVTALMAAARNNHPGIVKLLIEEGAALEIVNTAGNTALLLASVRGNMDCTKVLLEAGAEVDHADGEFGMTPLMHAARCDSLDPNEGHYVGVMRLLVAAGADVNAKDRSGETAFWCAVDSGSSGDLTLQFLVDAGAEIDVADGFGWTPLLRAANGRYEAKVGFLLKRGADVNHRNKDGDTPLIRASLWTSAEAVATIRLLLAAGADTNIGNNKGATALHVAAREGNSAGVLLLLESGADPSLRDKEGRTPLTVALAGGHTDVADVIRQHGARE